MHNELESLRKENEKLRQTVLVIENTSKMLVQRDLDLRQAYNELKDLEKEKSEFVSTAAHQLRTPLTTVTFAIQILSESISSTLDEAQLRVLDNAKLGAKNMMSLVNNLLVIDAFDYGKLQMSHEPFYLENAVNEVIGSLSDIIERSSLTISTDFSKSSKHVHADFSLVKDAISNIIHNASKYNQLGGTIDIVTLYNADTANIKVSDTGIGIDPEEVDKLFQKFSRCNNAKKLDANSSGLGLYIVARIMEKHQGTVTYKPNIPHGSIFTLSFPL